MSHSPTPESTTQPIIGLVMDYFNPKLLEGAKAYATANQLKLDARWSVRGDWLPEEIRWDGILHGLVDNAKTIESIKESTIPSLALIADDPEFSIAPDYAACAQLAVEELRRYGIHHLLICKEGPRFIDESFLQGAINHAEKHQIPHDCYHWISGSFRKMLDEVCQLIHSLPKPLGLCLPHAAIAHSITNALLKSGLHIPEDVSIVVVDKEPQQTSNLAPVPLTAVTLNEWHRGFIAAEMIHQIILGKFPKKKRTLISPRSIHGRASTGYKDDHDPIMAKALSYLRANYCQPIGVPEIVTASGSSRRSLEMKFREILDSTIHEELQRLRIEEAKHHLEEKKQSITDIAQRCGFSSLHYFSGAFKRETGISPRQHQQLHLHIPR